MIGPGWPRSPSGTPRVGEVRGLGVFWAVELVKDRETREPLVPYNAAGEAAAPMNAFAGACKQRGLWPMTHFNRTHVVPPCTITEQDLREGLAMLDEALDTADSLLHRQLTAAASLTVAYRRTCVVFTRPYASWSRRTLHAAKSR